MTLFLFHHHKERFDVTVPADIPVYVVEATKPVTSGDAHA